MPSYEWGGSLHLSYRLMPTPTPHLTAFLAGEGKTPQQLLATIPYQAARAPSGTGAPDQRRYRDIRQLYELAGFGFEEDGVVHITELGLAVNRWLTIINDKNAIVLGRYAAYALSACQLRNPIGRANYPTDVRVFPFAFIWRAMLNLDGYIGSDELNCQIFRVKDEVTLGEAIKNIGKARSTNDPTLLGPPTLTGKAVNDRLIPWMSMASFGWTLILDKHQSQDGNYRLNSRTIDVVEQAASIAHKHREFSSRAQYVQHISNNAALPPDLR